MMERGSMVEVSDKETVGDSDNISVYVLANKNNGVGFYRWTGGKLGSGRVYLPVDIDLSSNAGEYIVFGNDYTTIRTTTQDAATPDAPYFNLSGQRVNRPSQKGIYINDGKKVVIK